MSSAFIWFKDLIFGKTESETKSKDVTRNARQSPGIVDWTDSYSSNITLTRGLYHNTYPGFKLAGGLAFTPIAVPVWFMGLPIPEPVDEADATTAEELAALLEKFIIPIQQIHTECHRDGTVWVWPHWSAKKNDLMWEFIRDDLVTDIIRDLETREVVKIVTDEQITITTDYQKTAIVRRKREFTKTNITVRYIYGSSLIGNLKDVSMRNTTGLLPIPFSNNVESDEVRGHSDYERIITDLKDYHDIDLARSNMLSKFNAKLVLTCDDFSTWKTNNGVSSVAEIDIAKTDFIVLQNKDREAVDILYPETAHEAYSSALVQKFQKIVEASGIPEIAWGLKTTGNVASVEESMGTLVKFVRDKQTMKNDSYKKLFTTSLKILRAVNISSVPPEIKISWNDMDAVSDEVRSKIFNNFAKGIEIVTKSASITKDQLFKFWRDLYPGMTVDNYKEFEKGISSMAQHNQFNAMSYQEGLDFNQSDDDPGDQNQT